ncbi:MAG: Alkyl hydroperoxide reductase [Parcubacteria group bacterium Athens0416_74]|nr:MAG: Alkyl hydroperoxide reductase [Parcubacteria group bacterium Athens0416_74]
MYDLIIIGGGPAGTSAAVYAARKQLKTLFLTTEWGGQSAVSSEIQNWIGTPAIMGADLADALKKHVEAYKGEFLEVISPAEASKLATFDDHVEVTTKDGTVHSGKTAIVATGAQRRKLNVPGAAEHDNKGLTYCASCDGPLFGGMDVAVIGGGNAAFESALQLLAYCKSVTLLNRTDTFRADEISVAAAKSHPNMRIILNAEPTEVLGGPPAGGFVSGIKYKDTKSGEVHELPVAGIFVEIGLIPNSGWVGDTLEKNQVGQIKVDPRTLRSSHPRVWAAGDITDGIYHQNNIAAGDAVKALEDVYMFLRKSKSEA